MAFKLVSQFNESKPFEWDMGMDYAAELLQAIHILVTTGIKRVDGNGFKAYWAGEVLRVDIPRAETIT